MKVGQWAGATMIAAITMLLTWFSFADAMIDKKIEVYLREPTVLIDTFEKRLNRIELKLDRLLEHSNERQKK